MRELKFRYIIKCNPGQKDEAIKILDYDLSDIENSCTLEDTIYEDIQEGCNGNSSCQVNGFCECGEDYEDFEIIDRLQFIGLHGKNGKEIYDKDFIKTDFGIIKVDIEKIIIIDNKFYISLGFEGCYIKIIEITNCIYIGNEFENPELLK